MLFYWLEKRVEMKKKNIIIKIKWPERIKDIYYHRSPLGLYVIASVLGPARIIMCTTADINYGDSLDLDYLHTQPGRTTPNSRSTVVLQCNFQNSFAVLQCAGKRQDVYLYNYFRSNVDATHGYTTLQVAEKQRESDFLCVAFFCAKIKTANIFFTSNLFVHSEHV